MYSKTPLIFEQSKKGQIGASLPKLDVPEFALSSVIPDSLLRAIPAELPEVSEPEVVRHYTNLSVKNHHVDRDFYPLGSCTMKYNPKINDVISGLPGFAGLHPLQSDESAQGALKIIWELEQMLINITGMERVTLQPSAGAQGEFVGILMMKKYHESKNEDRKYIIIPETAHGTNPASIVFSGYLTRQVATDERGRVDIYDLKAKLDSDVAGMMLTQPNTLGLFEDRIEEISTLVHEVGGLMYMDGANLNALIGIVRPADMGFDITHINLHKTFSTPHGGGGPGSGPIAVAEELTPFLPTPMVKKEDEKYCWDYEYPQSIGPIHGFYGNFSILVRAWAFIKTMGESGLIAMTKQAVLNANYLKSLLEEKYHIPFSEGTLHEFVISGTKQKERGIRVLDIAKSLLDYGYHAPTIYFPINVPEAMMIEPTESETKQTLDNFANTLLEIDKRIDTESDTLIEAPEKTPVKRLDETKANRELNLRWTK
ncbi:MAG: aminomethyl-transferring glycine dehydrogenase subunit GcvPB [Candidatus Marinimicrobia bacterium]|nr:aminomethyl-transferring glycine dehydrogenase subunit GcvPB [Candidatus Neomarinimicrobiota bacterium]MBL7023356.1 aminomethyl-transferring glycine dehydrogenase subunit GcvPB [Candidatus Neomarinimicrobiota bacterium]MBL7109315.1 aminomethyl-transferring glycine dehydrogenase subunit GcvPB [Candidatus Neomarinimicrobiota bacterium]